MSRGRSEPHRHPGEPLRKIERRRVVEVVPGNHEQQQEDRDRDHQQGDGRAAGGAPQEIRQRQDQDDESGDPDAEPPPPGLVPEDRVESEVPAFRIPDCVRRPELQPVGARGDDARRQEDRAHPHRLREAVDLADRLVVPEHRELTVRGSAGVADLETSLSSIGGVHAETDPGPRRNVVEDEIAVPDPVARVEGPEARDDRQGRGGLRVQIREIEGGNEAEPEQREGETDQQERKGVASSHERRHQSRAEARGRSGPIRRGIIAQPPNARTDTSGAFR